MGVIYLAILGFLLLLILLIVMPIISIMLTTVNAFLSPFVIGLISIIGVVVIISFFWYGGETLGI